MIIVVISIARYLTNNGEHTVLRDQQNVYKGHTHTPSSSRLRTVPNSWPEGHAHYSPHPYTHSRKRPLLDDANEPWPYSYPSHSHRCNNCLDCNIYIIFLYYKTLHQVLNDVVTVECILVIEHTHTHPPLHTHTHTLIRTHARTHARTHTHTQTHNRTLLVFGFSLVFLPNQTGILNIEVTTT